MRIGISSPAFALEPFLKTLELVSTEFQHWEIVADLKQLLPDIKEEFKKTMPSYNLDISVHAPFNDLNIAALNLQLRTLAIDYIKETITTADKLDIKLISLHPGHLCPSGVYAVDKVKEANLKSLHEIDEFASNYNITLALENMPVKHWTLGNTATEILSMISNTDIGMCFDVGHAFILGEVDNFLNNIDHIKNVHVHDNNGRRDEHLVLGEGAIDYPYIIKTMALKYSSSIIIESNNIEEGIKSKKYLQTLINSV